MMEHTEKLYIKNFGPINEAVIDIARITILIGEQGAGKSTIAKLYALFTWLEKALMRHQLTSKSIMQYSRFRNKYCVYNSIDGYFKNDTELIFEGMHYRFSYRESGLEIDEIGADETSNEEYSISKVMYVPAERIILGCAEHPSNLKGLSEPMITFLDEYERAKKVLKSGYSLPFGDVAFEYDALNDISKLHYNQFDVKLSASASGYQSALPLLLVSKNLSDMVYNSLHSDNDLTNKERMRLQNEVESIMNDETLSDEVKMALMRSLSSRYSYSRFVNIVEEMELNLYPDSQKGMLYELISYTNRSKDNRLMLTTHSPYIVNYLTLAIKAGVLAGQAEGNVSLMDRIGKIVPKESYVDIEDWKIYEVSSGQARELGQYDGMPSDNNFLNMLLNDSNSSFDELLDIEEEIEQWKEE